MQELLYRSFQDWFILKRIVYSFVLDVLKDTTDDVFLFNWEKFTCWNSTQYVNPKKTDLKKN